jgi:hypothetical protein
MLGLTLEAYSSGDIACNVQMCVVIVNRVILLDIVVE